jgi:sugar phosphate isomerase/epimerase
MIEWRLSGERRTNSDRSHEREGATMCQSFPEAAHQVLPPFSLGVCSWSLQVKSIAELKSFLQQLGTNVVQIACGDPHHASWQEGDRMPAAALESDIVMTGAMLGFPGEDYTTPETIKQTGGFGNPSLCAERIERLKWGIHRTMALGLSDLSLHAGFLPAPGESGRAAVLEALSEAGRLAAAKGITLAFETGQETADLLRLTLDELGLPNLKVNFDPANMLLYDMGDPIRAVEILGPDIRSVHVKDARRPKVAGQWGAEVPLGEGEVNIPEFVNVLKSNGYSGPLIIEREVGDQAGRLRDLAHGLSYLRKCLKM